ncbi:MAG: TIGR00159 family protein [Bacteriovoracaceae bacterium]|nr:TIGR00159 family protein [Bacteriovoracaceae bacterium]
MSSIEILLGQVSFKDAVDILFVAVLIYQALLIIHGTRAVQILIGIGFLFILFWIGLTFKFYSLNWILEHFFDSFFIIAIVLFQDQIRAALASAGAGRNFNVIFTRKETFMDFEELVEACGVMSRDKIGALIVLERTNGLVNYTKTGSTLDGNVHSDMIYAIFQSASPLHDGAIIISNGKLAAAGCFLPLSKNVEIDRHLGTRHRASLGITEMTDAISITVSEETGDIHVSASGTFHHCRNENVLRLYLKQLWHNEKLELTDLIKKESKDLI